MLDFLFRVHLFKLVVHNLVIFIELHYLLKVAYKTGLTHYSECIGFFYILFILPEQNVKHTALFVHLHMSI